MRRRYDVAFDDRARRYVVEMTDEQGQQRIVESYTDWGAADHMRAQLNAKLEQQGELLPEKRR
jgi:hypothetical protein